MSATTLTRPAGPTTTPTRGMALRALGAGVAVTLVAVLVVLPGGTEARVTGSALIGLAGTWALVGRAHRWASVPAAAFGAAGALLVTLDPGATAMAVLAWLWPLPVTALAWWTWRRVRHLTRRERVVLTPVLIVLVLAAAGTLGEDVALRSRAVTEASGTSYDVGGRTLHLDCRGPDSSAPTV